MKIFYVKGKSESVSRKNKFLDFNALILIMVFCFLLILLSVQLAKKMTLDKEKSIKDSFLFKVIGLETRENVQTNGEVDG